MQSKNHLKTKRKIIQFLNEIDWLFGTNGFERDIVYKEHDEGERCAEINYDEPYQSIVLSIYPCFFEEKPEDQRKILLHELCHTITMPSKVAMRSLLDGQLITRYAILNINERETSRIENILDGLLQGRLLYAKKTYKNYLTK